MENNQPVKYRIGIFATGILLFLAGLSDLIELIVDVFSLGVAGWLVDIIESFLLVPIFYINGVNIFGSKHVIKWGATVLIGFIPFISTILPETIVGVLAIIISSRIEDRTGLDVLSKMNVKKGNITRTKRVRNKIRS